MPLYGGAHTRRVTVHDVRQAKQAGERWPMLTSYDALTAALFDEAGFPVLLVGDSAAMVMLGMQDTVAITVDDMLPMVRAVTRATHRAMVVADLPFGTTSTVADAVANSIRMVKEGGAQAVKIEGGSEISQTVRAVVQAGIPVMGHIGLQPQHVHATGGYRVQGRGEAGDKVVADAIALEQAGAFAVVLEVVPSELGSRVASSVEIPVIGIGAGPGTDAQVMVWQDLVGLSGGTPAKFVKQYADLRSAVGNAVSQWASDVASGSYPSPENSYT